jgi:hypothetical protein
MKTLKGTIAFLILMLSFAASAQVNKCLDRAGKVVGYGTECPAGTRSEATAIRNAPASAPAVEQKSLAERDMAFRKRQAEKQEALEKAREKTAADQERERSCERSRSYLKSLQAGQRITRTDPKTGERVFLSDAEYQTEIVAARQAIATHCK